MPLPSPTAGENGPDFMARCMGDEHMRSEFPDESQRAAVCHRRMQGEEMKADCSELLRCSGPDGKPYAMTMLMPWGDVRSENEPFVVDEESVRLMESEFAGGRKPIPIDYEHTTLGGQYATPSGAAPASGWITKLVAKPGVGIFGEVKWTEEAAAMILADKYRYLSPVLIVRKEDKKAVKLHSAALTNKPAIRDMWRVAAKEIVHTEEKRMDLKALRLALASAGVKLADDADDTAVLAATQLFIETAAKKPKEEALKLEPLAAKLGLGKDATLETITASVARLQTDMVPAVEYKAVVARLDGLEAAAKDRASQELVAYAIETAKLNPNHEASMENARKRAKTDPVGFKEWVDAAPELHPVGTVVIPSKALDGGQAGRSAVIASAAKEYDANPAQAMGARKASWVNAGLVSAGFNLLDGAELKAYADKETK